MVWYLLNGGDAHRLAHHTIRVTEKRKTEWSRYIKGKNNLLEMQTSAFTEPEGQLHKFPYTWVRITSKNKKNAHDLTRDWDAHDEKKIYNVGIACATH